MRTTEDSDQTGRMSRLILVLAGRTGHMTQFSDSLSQDKLI